VAWRASVESGELVTTLWLPGESVENKPDASSRRGCLEHEQILTHSERRRRGESDKRKESETPPEHPRAAELCALFDPFLLKSCQRSLTHDRQALLAACEEIGNVPQDWLKRAVNLRIQERAIRSPRIVAPIVKEIRQNWEHSQRIQPQPQREYRTVPYDPIALIREQRAKQAK
jgi:hypothetical protein